MNFVLNLALLCFILTEEEQSEKYIYARAEKTEQLEAYHELEEHSSNSIKLNSTMASDAKYNSFQYTPLNISVMDEINGTKWQNQMSKLILQRKRKRRKMWKVQHQWPLVTRNRRSSTNDSEDTKASNSSEETDLMNNRFPYLNRSILKDSSIALGCSPNCSNSEHVTNGCITDCYPEGKTEALCHKCNQICHYVAGTASKCGCYHGYAIGVDWQHCIDIDECSINPWLCQGGVCLNTVGSFLCRCQPGYHLIGHICVDINECSTAKGEQVPCHQVCVNVPGTYHCWCHKGFVPSANSSRSCIDINECKQRVCTHDCLNTVGSFVCKCPPNMLLHSNRRTCIPMTPGTFSVILGKSNSSLIIEQAGTKSFNKKANDFPSATIHVINSLDIEIKNHSKQVISQSGFGTAENASAAYSSPPRVFITDGNRGMKQEKHMLYSNWRQNLPSKGLQTHNLCIPACRNGGVCGENRKCNCRSGFQGRYCQIDVNECLKAPPVCSRFVCVNSIGSYQCLCPSGYYLSSDKNICIVVNSILAKPESLSISDTLNNEHATVRNSTNIEFSVSHVENINPYAPSVIKISSDSLYTTEVSKSSILKSEISSDTQSVLPDLKMDKDSAAILGEITGSEENTYSQHLNATNAPTPSLESSTFLSSLSTSPQNLDMHRLNNKQISDLIQSTSTVTNTSLLHNLFSFILGPSTQKQNNSDVSQLKVMDQYIRSAISATPALSKKSNSRVHDENMLELNYTSLSSVHTNFSEVSDSFIEHRNENGEIIATVTPEIQNMSSGYSEEYDIDGTQELKKLWDTNDRKHSIKNKQKHIGEMFIAERKSQILGRESQIQTGERKLKKSRKQFLKLIKDFHVLSQMLEDLEEPRKLQTKCSGSAGGKKSNHTSSDGEQCVKILDNEDDSPSNIETTAFNESYPEAAAPLYSLTHQEMKGTSLNGSKENHCLYKNKRIQSRMTYWDENNCTKCLCKNGELRCRSYEIATDCCKLPQNGMCCDHNPIDCLMNDEVYLSGEKFVSALDPCRECQCKNGDMQCDSITCVVNCHHPWIMPGECCPVCEGCHHFSRRFENQETFPHPSDSCKVCQCQSGNITCSPKPCTIKCTHPYKSARECCPLCRHCYFNGRKISNGASVMTNNGTCQKCTCKQGNLTCKNAPCEKSCIIRGKALPSGAEFHIGSDSCTQCHCLNGTVSCHAAECRTTCSHGVLLPNRCCLDCSKCDYKGELYVENEEFQPKEELCKRCRCIKGNVMCREVCNLTPIH